VGRNVDYLYAHCITIRCTVADISVATIATGFIKRQGGLVGRSTLRQLGACANELIKAGGGSQDQPGYQ
jgi:hypothetical protein